MRSVDDYQWFVGFAIQLEGLILTRAVVCGSQSASGIPILQTARMESWVKFPDGGSSLNCSWITSLSESRTQTITMIKQLITTKGTTWMERKAVDITYAKLKTQETLRICQSGFALREHVDLKIIEFLLQHQRWCFFGRANSNFRPNWVIQSYSRLLMLPLNSYLESSGSLGSGVLEFFTADFLAVNNASERQP